VHFRGAAVTSALIENLPDRGRAFRRRTID
jgi:hypothetical protein